MLSGLFFSIACNVFSLFKTKMCHPYTIVILHDRVIAFIDAKPPMLSYHPALMGRATKHFNHKTPSIRV